MKHINALRRILLRGTPKEREAIAEKIGTSAAYIQKIAGGWCSPSLAFMETLMKHYPRLKLQHLFDARKEREQITAKKRTYPQSKAAGGDRQPTVDRGG